MTSRTDLDSYTGSQQLNSSTCKFVETAQQIYSIISEQSRGKVFSHSQVDTSIICRSVQLVLSAQGDSISNYTSPPPPPPPSSGNILFAKTTAQLIIKLYLFSSLSISSLLCLIGWCGICLVSFISWSVSMLPSQCNHSPLTVTSKELSIPAGQPH